MRLLHKVLGCQMHHGIGYSGCEAEQRVRISNMFCWLWLGKSIGVVSERQGKEKGLVEFLPTQNLQKKRVHKSEITKSRLPRDVSWWPHGIGWHARVWTIECLNKENEALYLGGWGVWELWRRNCPNRQKMDTDWYVWKTYLQFSQVCTDVKVRKGTLTSCVLQFMLLDGKILDCNYIEYRCVNKSKEIILFPCGIDKYILYIEMFTCINL